MPMADAMATDPVMTHAMITAELDPTILQDMALTTLRWVESLNAHVLAYLCARDSSNSLVECFFP